MDLPAQAKGSPPKPMMLINNVLAILARWTASPPVWYCIIAGLYITVLPRPISVETSPQPSIRVDAGSKYQDYQLNTVMSGEAAITGPESAQIPVRAARTHPLDQLSIGETRIAREIVLNARGDSIIEFHSIALEETPESRTSGLLRR